MAYTNFKLEIWRGLDSNVAHIHSHSENYCSFSRTAVARTNRTIKCTDLVSIDTHPKRCCINIGC